MGKTANDRPVAGWFKLAAAASLLFMAVACVMFLLHVTGNPDTMDVEHRTAFLAEPWWVTVANGIGVISGLVGAILLLLKNRIAEALLLVSLAAAILWLAGLVIVRDLRENMTANDLLVAIVIAALTWTIYWFARHSRQRGWLS